MKIVYSLLLLTIIISCSKPEITQYSGETIGTTYSIKIVNGPQLDKRVALEIEIRNLFSELSMQMSTYIDSSEISRFNKATAAEPITATAPFLEVLNLAQQISVESGGAFDATVEPAVDLWGFGKLGRRTSPPSHEEVHNIKNYVGYQNISVSGSTVSKKNDKTELDFSAIAKGYYVDAAGNLLAEKGYNNYLVEIGGEVVVKGKNVNDNPWRIGVDRPLIEPTVDRGFEAVLELTDLAVATSGDYRNYFISDDSVFSHTIDPVTCRPIINGVASVTVIAPTCVLADAMATAIMVMGEKKGLEWVESKPGIETMIIVHSGSGFRVTSSSGFDQYIIKE